MTQFPPWMLMEYAFDDPLSRLERAIEDVRVPLERLVELAELRAEILERR